MRAARVGGAFWAPPAPVAGRGPVIDRTAGSGGPEVDPWSLLDHAQTLIAQGDDEWIALARIAGLDVEVVSPGRHGLPGEDAAVLDARIAAQLMAPAYRDPFTGSPADILSTIALLADWRRTLAGNRGIVAASGMAWWKRREIRRFLWAPGQRLALTRRPAA
ncbi:beta-3-deoxy-D-manno-oct-2-ulosonic acid transferase, partial [Novosphingobium sp. 1949]|nr:beta-3-deoxy-D-manno-oct-2-ulosonic acid transferase [Novosphingobium organovorum]